MLSEWKPTKSNLTVPEKWVVLTENFNIMYKKRNHHIKLIAVLSIIEVVLECPLLKEKVSFLRKIKTRLNV